VPVSAQPLTPLEIAGLAGFWSAVFLGGAVIRQTIPPRSHEPLSLPDAERVVLPSTDRLRLAAWRILQRPLDPWILVYPGIDQAPGDVLPGIDALRGAGFNLLVLLPRAHRPSQGSASSLGWLEQRDLEGALAYLSRQPEVPDRPMGLWAVSTGALAGLLVAARDERLGALALDSFAGPPVAALAHRVSRAIGLPTPLVWPLAAASYRLRFGAGPDARAIRQSAKALGGRPILLIHGTNDRRVRVAQATDWLDSARPHMCRVEGGDERTIPRTSPEYGQQLVEFFDAYLPRSPSTMPPRVVASI
jgi:hypothetical protein